MLSIGESRKARPLKQDCRTFGRHCEYGNATDIYSACADIEQVGFQCWVELMETRIEVPSNHAPGFYERGILGILGIVQSPHSAFGSQRPSISSTGMTAVCRSIAVPGGCSYIERHLRHHPV